MPCIPSLCQQSAYLITPIGSAIGFRLDSLLKLTDTRARNNKMTLMHYLCKVKLIFLLHLATERFKQAKKSGIENNFWILNLKLNIACSKV